MWTERVTSTARLGRAAAVLAAVAIGPALGADIDPYASNGGIFPTADEWSGPFRVLNADYPLRQPTDTWANGGGFGAVTVQNAGDYMTSLRGFVEHDVRGMFADPSGWDHAASGWYDMIWTGAMREPLLGAFSGQTILADVFADFGQTAPFTNHAIIYYNDVAAGMLGRVWRNPMDPDLSAIDFPEGSIVIKALGAEVDPADFPVLDGSAVWNVFAQPFGSATGTPPAVLQTRVIQFDIVVKDSIAAPGTGWVFSTYVYDKDAPGDDTWDRLVPLGAMWGNDPDKARTPDGGAGQLTETWVNPGAPAYTRNTIGWGGRLSGPMDLAERQNILFTDGTRSTGQTEVSACLSCHSTGQTPFIANLYPSPNKVFPPAGETFFMYPQGSADWARWYRNRDGTLPFSRAEGVVGTDYNMLMMFALGNFFAATGQVEKVMPRVDVH